jgi:hypothetical protein
MIRDRDEQEEVEVWVKVGRMKLIAGFSHPPGRMVTSWRRLVSRRERVRLIVNPIDK